ncbi:MAG: CorA family divalent cation transporter [Pirellulaceae bacterium]
MAASILPATWQIPAAIRNRLGNLAGRQRAMAAEGHLLLVLHAPPKPDDPERTGRFFWRNAQGEWLSKDLGAGIRALAAHIDEFEDVIHKLDRREEQATTVDEYFRVLEHLTPLHRSARNLYQVLQEARQLCPADREILNMRDRAYTIERNAELLFQETKNGLDFRMAKQAEAQSRAAQRMVVAAHRLNMLAAFFFPIATLTTVFGVNLRHGYEEQYVPSLFLVMVVIGLLLGCLLSLFVARRPRT